MKVNVLIDSSGWIEYFSKGPKAKKFSEFIQSAKKETHKTPTIVLFEVYKKLKKEAGEESANQAIAHIIDSTELIPLDERISIYAAELSIQTGLAMTDAIIKATAELYKAGIKTTDAHFKGLAEVEII